MRTLSQFLNEFLDQFEIITKAFRKIFQYFQFMAKKYRNVFSGVEHIANICGYSTATVKRATAFFARMGWICKLKRGYQSNVYFMNEELKDIDLDDPALFHRQKPPVSEVNDPKMIPYYSKCPNTCMSTKTDMSSHPYGTEKIHVPSSIRDFQTLSEAEKRSLAAQFSEYELMQAANDAKWYHGRWFRGKRNIIRNTYDFLISRCYKIRKGEC